MIELLIVIAIYAIVYLISWLVTVGAVKLITMCFGWGFSWAIATGVWLVLMLARWAISAARDYTSKG